MTEHLVSRQQARAITEEVEAAIRPIFEKHGFDTPKVKTTFGDYYAVKVESTPVELNEAGINVQSPEAQAYLLEAKFRPELDENALGREFTSNGERWVFVGFVPRRPKYPYVARRVRDGKVYKHTDAIEQHLAPEAS